MSRGIAYSSSPLLASKTPVMRSRLIVAGVALAFLGLAGRAAWVQLLNNDFFRKQGEVRFVRTLELPANRGRILDRNGQILASSVPVPSLWAIPEDLSEDLDGQGAEGQSKLRRLAQLLDVPLSQIKSKLADEDRHFVWLKRQVSEDVAAKVMALDLKGIYQRKEYQRQYPEGEASAHVVGFTNVEDHGQEGVELSFEDELTGKAGTRRVIKDRLGRVVEDVREQVLPIDGRDVQLSVDSKIQFFAWQKLREAVTTHKAKAASAVVLDVQSGEVLALGNYPGYAPQLRGKVDPAVRRNRAVTDTFEPGSTMKPFVVGLALDKGLVKPDSVIQTAPGHIQIAGATISDAHPHGALTVKQVIQKSSNVGVVKLAMQMQAREMWTLYSAIGLGQKPQLHFPGVVTGRLRPYKSWRPIEQASMSYGYGLSASLLQLARAYTVIARDGDLIPLSLVKLPADNKPIGGAQVMSAKTAQALRQMLHMVTLDGGTAPKAQTNGYSVGGKTGTAHKQEGKGYASKKYRSWFVGIAPIEKPRIVVAVMVDEPSAGQYFGGEVAAPVFSQVVQQSLRLLGLAPDLNVKPQSMTQNVEESI